MWQFAKITLLSFFTFFSAFGQTKEFYAIKTNEGIDKLNLTLSATSGTCLIQSSKTSDVIRIFGSEDQNTYNPKFDSEIVNRVQMVNFDVQNNQQSGMSKVLSGRMFGSDPCKKNNWSIQVSDSTPLDLNLNYVVGEADVDLAGLLIQNLKINTGNANVKIGFSDELYNAIEMDHFFARVDMGTLQIHQLNFSKAKEIVAEVGVGKLVLDFSNPNIICKSNVSAKVGAGSMEILMIENLYPILIKINNSPLCHIKMPKSFKKIDKDTFANDLYKPGADHMIVFDLNVTLGQITFSNK